MALEDTSKIKITQIHPYNPATGFKLYGYEQTRERIVEETATSRDTLEKDVQS